MGEHSTSWWWRTTLETPNYVSRDTELHGVVSHSQYLFEASFLIGSITLAPTIFEKAFSIGPGYDVEFCIPQK